MITASECQRPVKVSIVLPTFNQSKYLLNAIQSILNQTYQDYELIIVSDELGDDVAQLLANISLPRIRVITQANQGISNALNTGFAVARGEYWTWTLADNLVSPSWLEELVKALDQAPADVGYAFSYYAIIDEEGKMLYVNRNQRFDIPSLLLNYTGNASFLYRSSLAKKIGHYDSALKDAEDLDMWVRMAEETRAINVELILYYFRQHSKWVTIQQDNIKETTKRVVNKYLDKTHGKFDIDPIFPSIKLSADPVLEKWKARMWLITLGAKTTFYCPVDALVDQQVLALNENYERGMVSNIVHLLAKEDRWDSAAETIMKYYEKDPCDLFKQLRDIISRKDKNALQTVPFLTLDEKHLASDCHGSWTQIQLVRNLASTILNQEQKSFPFEQLVKDWISLLEDQKDHPEIWQSISSLRSPEDKLVLQKLRSYLAELINVPQEPQALILLKLIEVMCFAYAENFELGKSKLQMLNKQYPNLPVVMGALIYICQDDKSRVSSLIPSVTS